MKQNVYPLLCLLLFVSLSGMAQPGSLDRSFGSLGKLTAGFLLPSIKTSDQVSSVAIQADGKIVVAGWSVNGSDSDFAVVRYNATGTLDNTFSLDGKVTTDIAGFDDFASSVAIQADGKIVVAGWSENSSGKRLVTLVRYNSNGTLDNTFSGDGKLTTDLGIRGGATSVAIQVDGKIVVAGYSNNGSNTDIAVVRYNTNGILDNTFSGDGKLTTDFGSIDDEAYSVAIQADGKIVVAGYTVEPLNHTSVFALARYNTDGTLDNTFSGDGKLTTDFGGFSGDAYSVAIQQDGKIVAVGYFFDGSTNSPDFALVRYNTDGTLDNTFSLDGKVTTDIAGSVDFASSVAIQADGKIVAAGWSLNSSDNFALALARYNTDGTLDNTFSGDGKLTTAFASTNYLASALAIQVDGRIVLAGESNNGSNYDFAVMRYNTDGSLDISFADDGKITTDIGTNDTAAIDNSFAVAVRSNGKIVVAGTSSLSGSNPKSDLSIVQFNANGTLDNSFGFQGKVLGEFEGGNFIAHAATIQPDGKIIVGGYFDHGKQDFALVRYNANGSLDNTFSGDGFVTTAVSQLGPNKCQALVVQPDGKILAAGWSQSCISSSTFCKPDFALVRYNANGSLDNTFSGDGILTTDFSSATDVINSVALQPDGKIVAAGYSYYNGKVQSYDIAVARYNTNGDLDNTFSGDGKLITGFSNYDDYAQSVKIQGDGKIIVGGYSGKTSVKDNDFVLVRYNTNGTPDNTFNGNGTTATTISGTSADYCNAIAIELSGNIIAGGYYINAQGQADFALVRYLSNGTPDKSFGTAGKVITDFANTNDFGTAITIGGDGKLVMAGHSNNDFAVARYNLAAAALTNMAAVKQEIKSAAVEVSPNPFFSKTSVSFTLDKDASVKIDLLDATGIKIKTIENERLSKGVHQVELSKGNLTAGIYFLRILNGNEIQTKKLIIE